MQRLTPLAIAFSALLAKVDQVFSLKPVLHSLNILLLTPYFHLVILANPRAPWDHARGTSQADLELLALSLDLRIQVDCFEQDLQEGYALI